MWVGVIAVLILWLVRQWLLVHRQRWLVEGAAGGETGEARSRVCDLLAFAYIPHSNGLLDDRGHLYSYLLRPYVILDSISSCRKSYTRHARPSEDPLR